VAERDPDISRLLRQPGEPARLGRAEHGAAGLVGEPQVVVPVAAAEPFGNTLRTNPRAPAREQPRGQQLRAELPHHIVQVVAAGVRGRQHEGLLRQPRESLRRAGAADVLHRVGAEGAGEHRELRPQPLLGRRAQLVAPGDERAERALVFGGGAAGAGDA